MITSYILLFHLTKLVLKDILTIQNYFRINSCAVLMYDKMSKVTNSCVWSGFSKLLYLNLNQAVLLNCYDEVYSLPHLLFLFHSQR